MDDFQYILALAFTVIVGTFGLMFIGFLIYILVLFPLGVLFG